MRISDWSSDVCSSDVPFPSARREAQHAPAWRPLRGAGPWQLSLLVLSKVFSCKKPTPAPCLSQEKTLERFHACPSRHSSGKAQPPHPDRQPEAGRRSEEHTSELQSLTRNSYAVFCLKKTKK